MKKNIILLLSMVLIVGLVAGCSGKNTDPNKKAILALSFGTSYSDTRALTIEATVDAIRAEYPDYDVKMAFTSQTVINILLERDNIEIDNLKDALDKLKKEHYSEVIVQSLHIIPGEEFNVAKEELVEYQDSFDKLVIGNPLLNTHEDYEKVILALESQMPALAENEAVVFMGHGTHHPANSTYSALDYMLKQEGYNNVYIGTVEGYPLLDVIIDDLKEKNIEKITLMPLMLVAGDHANNDMAGDEEDSWKTVLKKEGFSVETYLHGLGENDGVRALFIEHLDEAIYAEEVAE